MPEESEKKNFADNYLKDNYTFEITKKSLLLSNNRNFK